MGIWNSHTSVGNILGSLIAGVFVSSAWGLSFIVPGIIIAAAGVICFLFLVESKSHLRLEGNFPLYACRAVYKDRNRRETKTNIVQLNYMNINFPLLQPRSDGCV